MNFFDVRNKLKVIYKHADDNGKNALKFIVLEYGLIMGVAIFLIVCPLAFRKILFNSDVIVTISIVFGVFLWLFAFRRLRKQQENFLREYDRQHVK